VSESGELYGSLAVRHGPSVADYDAYGDAPLLKHDDKLEVS
jgi:hypothetical protein